MQFLYSESSSQGITLQMTYACVYRQPRGFFKERWSDQTPVKSRTGQFLRIQV